jgi:hypothetical protein
MYSLLKKSSVIGMLFAAALIYGCGASTESLDRIPGTYRLVSFKVDGRDTLLTIDSIPFPLGENEIRLVPSTYKGNLSGLFQGPLDSSSVYLEGEYYLANRRYRRVDLNTTILASTIILGVDHISRVTSAFPERGQVLTRDSITRDDQYRSYLINGAWMIDKEPVSVGELMILSRRGIGADSVRTYQLTFQKKALK